ncbi:MAG: GyrI-like domain-containing protein [Lachnospiraceae bacterium]|nr:GyrI-like domain-containing protein [Lachnospiraceae bacterium]
MKELQIERCTKSAFVVIGKEGSTKEGNGFIQRLWMDANSHFGEIEKLVKRNEDGSMAGVWGAMSDFSREFRPWQNEFTQGLYLAGAECRDDAVAPEGWTRWIVPGFEFLKVKNEGIDMFGRMIAYMKTNHIELVGAVHDFTCPKTGEGFMFFPIKKL